MSKVILVCELCEFETRSCGTKWKDHLLGEAHQILTRERNRGAAGNKRRRRRCVVFGIRELSYESVLSFFSEKDLVTDFVVWKEHSNICLVEFLFPKAAEDVASRTKCILGNEVLVRWRKEIPKMEWESICPVRDILRVKKEQVEDEVESLSAEESLESLQLVDDDSSGVQISGVTVKEEANEDEVQTVYESSSRKRVASLSLESDCVELPGSPADSPKSSAPPPKKPFEELTDDQFKSEVSLKKLKLPWSNRFHSLTMVPTKQFLLEAADATNIEMYVTLNGLWLQLIQEFNLLVWENFFGVELHEITPDDIVRVRPMKPGYLQDGPFIRGTLTEMDKISEWTQRVEAKSKNRAKTAKKRIVEKCRREYFKCLEEGSLKPVPMRYFDEKARCSFERETALLRFDLQTLYVLPGTNPVYPVLVDLQFQNINTSPEIKFGLFKQMVKMYKLMWNEFCLLKLNTSH